MFSDSTFYVWALEGSERSIGTSGPNHSGYSKIMIFGKWLKENSPNDCKYI